MGWEMGGRFKRKEAYLYLWLIHFDVWQKPAQYHKAIIPQLKVNKLEKKERKWSHPVVSNSLRPHGLYPTKLLRPWNFSGKCTGVGCHFLLQGIFLTQGSNPGLPHCRQTLYHLWHQGSKLENHEGYCNNPCCTGKRIEAERGWVRGQRVDFYSSVGLVYIKGVHSHIREFFFFLECCVSGTVLGLAWSGANGDRGRAGMRGKGKRGVPWRNLEPEVRDCRFQVCWENLTMACKTSLHLGTQFPSPSHHLHVLSRFSHVWLFATLWIVPHKAALSNRFSRREYWSGLPFPSPGDFPNPRIKPLSLTSPVLAGGFFTASATWINGASIPSHSWLFAARGTWARPLYLQSPLSAGHASLQIVNPPPQACFFLLSSL